MKEPGAGVSSMYPKPARVSAVGTARRNPVPAPGDRWYDGVLDRAQTLNAGLPAIHEDRIPMNTTVKMCGATLLVVCALGLGACSDDDGTAPPPPEFPIATSAPRMTELLVSAYRNRDFDGYLRLVDPSFTLVGDPGQYVGGDLARTPLSYEEDRLATSNIFSGNEFVRPDQSIVPGVTGIAFDVFQPAAAWRDTAAADLIPGTAYAPYQVMMLVDQGTLRLRIEGILNVFASPDTVEYNAEQTVVWRLTRLVDDTAPPVPGKAIEELSWLQLKNLYLEPVNASAAP